MSSPTATRALPRRRTGRRSAGLGVAVGLVVAAALAVPVPAAEPVPVAAADPAPPAPGPGAIGPGVRIATPIRGGAELCTANFLFTGAGRLDGHADGEWGAEHQAAPSGDLYLGAAAHCTAAEESMSSVNGCVEPVLPDGTEVRIAGRDGRTYSGTVAYNSWRVMQDRGETDRDLCLFNDLSLIRLSPEAAAVADPTVPGFGGPTGLDTDGTVDGEPVYSHQPNQLPATPNKRGVSLGRPEGPRTHVVLTAPGGVPGDSGAGFLDREGRAFGLLSSLLAPTSANGVTDLALALDYAAEHGRLGPVELVPGTRPFSPAVLPLAEQPTGPQAPPRPLPELTPVPLH